MRNFLFASGDFPDVTFAFPYKAQARSVGKALGFAENLIIGAFVYQQENEGLIGFATRRNGG